MILEDEPKLAPTIAGNRPWLASVVMLCMSRLQVRSTSIGQLGVGAVQQSFGRASLTCSGCARLLQRIS